MRTPLFAAALGLAAFAAGAGFAASQQGDPPAPPQWSWPERMENPQVLAADTPPARLRAVMMGFVGALGVRCEHCHVSNGADDLSGFDFAADDNPRKNIARGMMRMAGMINREALPAIEGLTQPRVTCYTCHRGSTIPAVSAPEQD